MAQQLDAYKIKYQREFVFAPPRRWRFDFVLGLEHGTIAIEVDGGTWQPKSRHGHGRGYERDCEKFNAAVSMGWKVYRFTTAQVTSGSAIAKICEILGIKR